MPLRSRRTKVVSTLHFSKSARSLRASRLFFKRITGIESHPRYARIARTLPQEPPAKVNEGRRLSLPTSTKSRATNPDPTQTGLFFFSNFAFFRRLTTAIAQGYQLAQAMRASPKTNFSRCGHMLHPPAKGARFLAALAEAEDHHLESRIR